MTNQSGLAQGMIAPGFVETCHDEMRRRLQAGGADLDALRQGVAEARERGRPALVALAAVLALVVTPILALGASHLLGLTGVARQAALVQSGMPSAVLTTILALEFDVAPSFVTACVLTSTLASPLTVTLLIAALR